MVEREQDGADARAEREASSEGARGDDEAARGAAGGERQTAGARARACGEGTEGCGPERGRESWSGPFSELGSLVGDLLEGVRAFPAGALRGPRLDVVRTPAEYVVLVDLPGVAREEVEVTTGGEELTIAGRRPRPEWPSEAEVVRREREYGRFRRSIPLWPDVDVSGVRARFDNGVLRISLPRRRHAESQRVDIES